MTPKVAGGRKTSIRQDTFIQAISIAPLQVLYMYYSEALPTQPEFHAEAPQATVS